MPVHRLINSDCGDNECAPALFIYCVSPIKSGNPRTPMAIVQALFSCPPCYKRTGHRWQTGTSPQMKWECCSQKKKDGYRIKIYWVGQNVHLCFFFLSVRWLQKCLVVFNIIQNNLLDCIVIAVTSACI